jgi:hypothetical protein
MERQYHDDFFSGYPRTFAKKTILGIAGKEQSERRTSASAVVTEVPSPDAGPNTDPQDRRSPVCQSHDYIPHASKSPDQ